MKIHRGEREPRLQARSVLEQMNSEATRNELQGFLSSTLYIYLKDLAKKTISARPRSHLENLSEAFWVGAVDPAYANDIQKNMELRGHVLEHLSGLENELSALVALPPKPETDEDEYAFQERPIDCELKIIELGSKIAQIFPDERDEVGFEDFTSERLDRVLAWISKGGVSFKQKISLAFELITLWPKERSKIIETIFSPLDLQVDKLKYYFSPRPPASAKQLGAPTIVRRPKSHDGDLGIFLVLFPELRVNLEPYIEIQKSKLHTELAGIGTNESLLPKFITTEQELLFLSAQKAELNEEGKLKITFSAPIISEAKPLPQRAVL